MKKPLETAEIYGIKLDILNNEMCDTLNNFHFLSG